MNERRRPRTLLAASCSRGRRRRRLQEQRVGAARRPHQRARTGAVKRDDASTRRIIGTKSSRTTAAFALSEASYRS